MKRRCDGRIWDWIIRGQLGEDSENNTMGVGPPRVCAAELVLGPNSRGARWELSWLIPCLFVCLRVRLRPHSYMNSYLQTLFYLPAFRRAVYSLPVEASQLLELLEPSASSSTVVTTKDIPLALQHLFYTLDKSDVACNTKKLTQSFGWTAADSFQQHDVSAHSAGGTMGGQKG